MALHVVHTYHSTRLFDLTKSKSDLIYSSFAASSYEIHITETMSSVENIESIANKEKPLSLVERIARPNILSLVPYRCARDDYSEGVLLDANENSFGSPLASPEHQKLSRYPCPHQLSLKSSYAKFRSSQIPHVTIKPEQIFCGVGSDEAIDLLLRIFCAPSTQDSILITPPTYGMYSVCAKINDVAIVKVPLTPDFDVSIEEVSTNASCLCH